MGKGLALIVSLHVSVAALAQAPPVSFAPTSGVPTFAVREPVLHLKPGMVVETQTFSKDGDYYDPEKPGPWPGEVGPFYIDGATPNDTLVVRILKLRPNRDTAISAINPAGISGLSADGRTRMLNDPLPARRFVWQIDRSRSVGVLELPGSAVKRIEIPLMPMLGRVAVAPAGDEAWGGLWPGNFGGNMDVPDVCQGSTVYLPIFHEGAYFYFGDGHAAQCDGEVIGSGLETTMDVTFQFDLIKGRRIRWPRIENSSHIMVAGSVRPLIDAFRIAHVELVEWLTEEFGFEKLEAYQVVSQAGSARVANIVDPNYTVVAKFPKSLLPASSGRAVGEPASIEQAVLNVLDRATEAAEALDAEKLFSFMLETDTGSVIQNGRFMATRQEALDQTAASMRGIRGIEYTWNRRHVTVLSPGSALLTAEGESRATTEQGDTFVTPFCQSIVLVLSDGQWKILHSHQSSSGRR